MDMKQDGSGTRGRAVYNHGSFIRDHTSQDLVLVQLLLKSADAVLANLLLQR